LKVSVRLIPAAIAAAFLAACSGGNGTTTLPQSSVPQAKQQQPTVNAFSVVENGAAVAGTHIFPSRENGGLIAMAHAAGSSANLVYGGGPVQRNVKIYLVFWQFGSNDPNGEASRLTSFTQGLGGSQWMGTLNQYYDNTGSISNDAVLGGTWSDSTNSIPSRPSQNAVAAEAARAAAHFGDYSVNAMYFIALEKGHDPSGFRTQWCAFHSATSASGSTIAYTDFPYQTDAGASCGENSVNSGSAGVLDGVTIVGGHELAEGVTDPHPSSGWVDSTGAEIGDKCAWTNLKNTSFSTGTFPTQPLWSNSAGGCVQ
jgi:serine protease